MTTLITVLLSLYPAAEAVDTLPPVHLVIAQAWHRHRTAGKTGVPETEPMERKVSYPGAKLNTDLLTGLHRSQEAKLPAGQHGFKAH